MKQKIKNDVTLAERMWWSIILAVGFLFVFLKEARRYFPIKPSSVDFLFIPATLVIGSVMFMLSAVYFSLARKKNRHSVEKLTDSGIKVTGKVEEIIQKSVFSKYILRVSYKDPHTYEDVTAFTPLLHKDPRHYITVGNNIDVYVDSDDRENFYIDVKDE